MKRKKLPVKSDLNVVPYIDVMLVLLVIFMISAPIINQGIEIDLPKSEKGEEIKIDNREDLPMVITIDKDHNYSISYKGDNISTSLSDLENFLKGLLAENPNQKVYLKADKNIRYEYVMNAMSIAKKAGANSISLMTSPPKKDLNNNSDT